MTSKGRRHFGSVRKLPSGRYQASYWHERLRQVAPLTFLTKADALAYLSTIEVDLRRGTWIDPHGAKLTLAEYSRRWVSDRAESKPLAERTVELYNWLLERYLVPSLGATELGSLRPSAVRAWHAALSAEHPSTAAKAYRLLAAITKTAVTDGLIASSPCRVEGGGAERAPERPVATVAEVMKLAEAIDERLRAAVLLAAWCQLRRGEVLGLRRVDIDLGRALIHVCQTRVVKMDGENLTKAPKSTAGHRSVAIPPNIVGDLAQHLDRYVGSGDEALVFTGEKGAPLAVGMLQAAWDGARRATGLSHFRYHDLRHAGLTWSAASGATVAELMRRGGHASPAAALRYQHATEDRDRAIARALSRLADGVEP